MPSNGASRAKQRCLLEPSNGASRAKQRCLREHFENLMIVASRASATGATDYETASEEPVAFDYDTAGEEPVAEALEATLGIFAFFEKHLRGLRKWWDCRLSMFLFLGICCKGLWMLGFWFLGWGWFTVYRWCFFVCFARGGICFVCGRVCLAWDCICLACGVS